MGGGLWRKHEAFSLRNDNTKMPINRIGVLIFPPFRDYYLLLLGSTSTVESIAHVLSVCGEYIRTIRVQCGRDDSDNVNVE